MDSIHPSRQDQNPKHDHQNPNNQPNQNQNQNQNQGHHNHNPQSIGPAPFHYPNNGGNQHDDSFSTFFNVDGTSGFDSTWAEPSTIIDPRLQTNGYTPSPGPWHQNPLHPTNSLQNAGPDLVANEYANAFAQNPNIFTYSGYNASQFQTYGTNSFDPTLSYANGPMLGTPNFQDPNSQAYGPSTASAQGQTISPSALQTYPNHYGQLANQLDQSVCD